MMVPGLYPDYVYFVTDRRGGWHRFFDYLKEIDAILTLSETYVSLY